MSTAATTDWRVLPAEHDEPARLLERGVALLDAIEDDPVPTLRWYTSTSTAIVLGRGQRRVAVRAPDGIHTVMRSSGGGAVLMDPGLLSLDVLLPHDDPWLDGDLATVFGHVGRAWAKALTDLGVPGPTVHEGPSTTPRTTTPRGALTAAVCYASMGRGEVEVGGRKLVGLAQRRRRQGALVQCGLLRAWDPSPLLTALGARPDDPDIAGAAVGLAELLPAPPDTATIMTAVENAFDRREAAPGRGATDGR
jgi:lipoate---protein ligase